MRRLFVRPRWVACVLVLAAGGTDVFASSPSFSLTPPDLDEGLSLQGSFAAEFAKGELLHANFFHPALHSAAPLPAPGMASRNLVAITSTPSASQMDLAGDADLNFDLLQASEHSSPALSLEHHGTEAGRSALTFEQLRAGLGLAIPAASGVGTMPIPEPPTWALIVAGLVALLRVAHLRSGS